MFLSLLADVCERFNWWGHAYCLMTNHYHLGSETILGVRTQAWQRRLKPAG